MASDEKKKALDAAIAKLEKDFGKGAVMKLGESGAHVAVETVPTGCLSLDIALGLGGVPKGRVIEVYGPESSPDYISRADNRRYNFILIFIHFFRHFYISVISLTRR